MKIAISGQMGSGKTTLANHINKHFNNIYYITSFAKKLKEIACELFNMDINNKDRLLLQQLGQSMRNINNDVWINYTIKDSNKYNDVIIDDVRFENEIYTLKQNNFILIKLNISNNLQVSRLHKTYCNNVKSHINNSSDISETSINNVNDDIFDLIINVDNDNVFTKTINFLNTLK
jgi:cytidylate kinase